MKIKLKEGKMLESFGSHQGFHTSIWAKLNAGQIVEVDSIPARAIGQVEEVISKVSKPKKADKVIASTKKLKKNNKGGE